MKQIEKLDERIVMDDRDSKINEIIDAVNDLLAGEPAKLRVRINTHGNPLPESHGEWIDLRTAEDVVLRPLEYKRISLGVSMELPAGYYAHMLPRSSTCERYGIVMGNSMGVFENDFCGDNDVWGFPAVAIKETFICRCSLTVEPQPSKLVAPVRFRSAAPCRDVQSSALISTPYCLPGKPGDMLP